MTNVIDFEGTRDGIKAALRRIFILTGTVFTQVEYPVRAWLDVDKGKHHLTSGCLK